MAELIIQDSPDQRIKRHQRIHDDFNLIVLPVISVLSAIFLLTGQCYTWFSLASYLYFLVDFVWILLIPASVRTPTALRIHHAVVLGLLSFPLFSPRYRWHFAADMIIEFNSWFIIARRRFPGTATKLMFYASWILIRLIWYPYLIVVFFRDTHAAGGSLLYLAPLFQTILSGMNYYWTLQLLCKPRQKALRKEE